MFLKWVFITRVFPEKTPEESDDATTLHESRPKCHIPDENKSPFFTRFTSRGDEYSRQESPATPWFIGGLGDSRQKGDNVAQEWIIPASAHYSRLHREIGGVGLFRERE